MASSRAQAFETAGVRQHLPSLLAQRWQRANHVLLLSHTNLKHPPGIGLAQHSTKGRQIHGEAICIFDRSLAVLLGHTQDRLDWVRTDRQAEGV